jgi:hypothetical protein
VHLLQSANFCSLASPTQEAFAKDRRVLISAQLSEPAVASLELRKGGPFGVKNDEDSKAGGNVTIAKNITLVIDGINLPPMVPEDPEDPNRKGLRDLLAALNLTDAAAQGALFAVQRLELFERWVVTATSPDALENVVLPSIIWAAGKHLCVA